jgi:hypothetical protein
MEIRKLYLTENDCYKAGRYIKPKGIMVHSTGADNPNLCRYLPDDGIVGVNAYNNHWNQSGIKACVHGFIGKDKDGIVRVYQTLPWNMRAWHCGRSGNDTHISFEICEDGLHNAEYFKVIYGYAIELCVFLCETYGLTAEDIIDHHEGNLLGIASGHGDVSHWFPIHGKSMDTLRADVRQGMEDDMASVISQIAAAAGKSEAEVIQALGLLCKFANTTEEAWEKAGAKSLIDMGVISSARDSRELVEFGELGTILKNFKNKYIK